MNNNDLFINNYSLPDPLSKCEVYDLLEKMAQGDEKAKSKLAMHNIKLVLHQVMGRFKTVEYDKSDLISIGTVGLMKAIETFDISSKLEFSTYAARCIDNEILMFLRNLKKHDRVKSFDDVIGNYDDSSDKLKIINVLSSDINVEEQYIDKELCLILHHIINRLPDRDRKMIMLYFGFFNNRTYTQKDIAKMFNMSPSYVSRLISLSVESIKEQLERLSVKDLKTVGNVNISKKLKKFY